MTENSNDGRPLGERNYRDFADRYAEAIPTKPHNAYYERPATLSLLPDLAGKDVLDLGCGPGIYAEIFADAGARVTAVDVTPRMLEIAKKRLKGRAVAFRLADLAEPLPFPDAGFDVAVAPLVLDYLEDWYAIFREIARVLRPGGTFVYSAGHPMFDWNLVGGDSYFTPATFSWPWGGYGEPKPVITGWRRSLQDMINPIAAAGLVLDRLLEPLPTEDFAKADPEDHAKLMKAPAFLCVRARKPA